MKKSAVVLGSSLALLAGSVVAELEGSSSTKVFVQVDSSIAVKAAAVQLNLGSVMFGDFNSTIDFMVQSNNESVNIAVAATNLYKGYDTSDPDVAPLTVAGKGAMVTVDGASPMGGKDNLLEWTDAYSHEGGFMGKKSEYTYFESSQDGYFDKTMTVDVSWNAGDRQTEGEYGGYVTLWASITK